jgi:predicted regulator of Ras-like GTPase activity (Roadblock/LC7/MglB family)
MAEESIPLSLRRLLGLGEAGRRPAPSDALEEVSLSALLQRFRASHLEVEGAAVIDASGTIVAGDLPDRFRTGDGSLGMTLLRVGQWVAAEYERGPLGFLVVGCENGVVVARPIGGKRVLVLVASAETTFRLIFSDSLQLVEQIERAVKGKPK